MSKYIRAEDWMNAAKNKEFAEYMKRARKRLDEGEIAAAREIKKIYRRVAKQIADEIAGAVQGTLRYSHLEYLHKVLNEAARQINDDLLKAINKGIYIAVEASTEAAQQTFIDLAKEIWAAPVIKQAFATINERAVMALLARTGPDGLKLSDRVWRISQRARNALKVIVEDSVVRGLDARKMARQVQRYLQPGVWTALKEETRKRLGVPRDVSMEAMRLAVTEMHNAFHEGTRMAWSAVPGVQGYYWRLSNWHPITDICDDYASHNGDGFWAKDQVPIKPHPWCRCYIIPAVEEVDKFVSRLKEWVVTPEAHPDIEMWYNNIREFISRPNPMRLSDFTKPASPFVNLLTAAFNVPRHTAEKIEEILEDIRKRTVEEGVEFAAMVDWASGNVTGKVLKGDQSWCDIGPHLDAMIEGRTYIHMHTHPASSSFSDADAALLAYYDKLKMMVVAGADGTKYVLLRTDKVQKGESLRATKRQITEVYNEENQRLRPKYMARYFQGEPEDKLWKEHSNEIWENIAEKLGFVYRRILGR